LIHRGAPTNNQISNPDARGEFPGSLGPKVFRLNNQLPSSGKNSQDKTIQFGENSTQALIGAAYRQVFGRDLYEGQKLTVSEIKLENGDITVREFIKNLAKSEVFIKLYWTPFYVVKAIEYIHRRLLGRPTYGRKEINAYFDLASKKGVYAVIDAMLDSKEYEEAFGDDTVPYERYLTPGGLQMRTTRPGTIREEIGQRVDKETTPRFIELGQVHGLRTEPDIKSRINQGVTAQREQSKAFKLLTTADKVAVETTVRAAYRQIFERDLEPYIIEAEFTKLESKLSNREINVKEFIEGLGISDLYIKEFYAPFPNTKVIELGTKHFLGRAPINQKEIQKYNQILANEGIRAFITSMVNSLEYQQLFGEDTVPYRRYPTLPAANFPNTERLYNKLTKQDSELVVPSFKPVKTGV
jgi:phycobilisome core-membrane linker protein